ncbi:MAG: hypothetical protein ACI4SH_08295, partial [Candidatus Scatosoma sp.]
LKVQLLLNSFIKNPYGNCAKLSGDTVLTDKSEYYAVTAVCSFVVDGTKYYTFQNVTWAEWIESVFCSWNFRINNGNVSYKKFAEDLEKTVRADGANVSPTDIIDTTSGTMYEVTA